MRKVRSNIEERRILELCDIFQTISYTQLHNECELSFGKIDIKDDSSESSQFHSFMILYDKSDNSLISNKTQSADDPKSTAAYIEDPYEKSTVRIIERIYSVLTESDLSFFWDKLMDEFEDKTGIDMYFLISFCYLITKYQNKSTATVDLKKREDRAISNTIFALLDVKGITEDYCSDMIVTEKEESILNKFGGMK